MGFCTFGVKGLEGGENMFMTGWNMDRKPLLTLRKKPLKAPPRKPNCACATTASMATTSEETRSTHLILTDTLVHWSTTDHRLMARPLAHSLDDAERTSRETSPKSFRKPVARRLRTTDAL